MPFYQYKCLNCQEEFESFRNLSEPPLTKCEICGEGGVKKLLTAPKIKYKEPWRKKRIV